MDSDYNSGNIVDDIFEKLDVDMNNQINFQQFLCSFIEKQEINSQKFIHEAFQFIDRDKNGIIDIDELK